MITNKRALTHIVARKQTYSPLKNNFRAVWFSAHQRKTIARSCMFVFVKCSLYLLVYVCLNERCCVLQTLEGRYSESAENEPSKVSV